jgi:trehalose/maltose hydrolase-like predicted phosphorylase
MSEWLSPIDSKMGPLSVEEETQFLRRGAGQAALRGRFRSSEPNWLLMEEGFTLPREHEIESLFAIGNGYVGNRGSLAEGSALSAPATFVAGVFQQLEMPGSVPELMVLPDWTNVRIWIDHQPLSMERGEVLEHRRILDFRGGMLWREWRHRDPEGRITRIEAFRLASLADRHLLLHVVTLKAENYSALVRFETSLQLGPGAVSLLAPEWKTRIGSARPNLLPLAMRAPGRDTSVAFGVTSQMFSSDGGGRREVDIGERRIMEHCEIQMEGGTECQLQRLISIFSSRESENPFDRAMVHLKVVMPKGFSSAVSAHESAWESRWRDADIEIEGDDFLQRALRFAAYHLISAANPDDSWVSIGARTLSGAAYKGHVFWDTEIYMLPFYIYTHPPSARALLEYRYHTLDAARSKARSRGYRGAFYPWESADTGEEVTPQAIIAPNGEILNILNGELEVHITSDVAHGVWQYWRETEDGDFFSQFGAEIMLESARFWASRGAVEAGDAFHIRDVISPDEYHEHVDDSAYTNLMAAWNLRRGAETANLLKRRWPDRWQELSSRLQFAEDEINAWPRLADAMFTGFDPQTLVFEQFSGYFRKQEIDLMSYEPRTAAMDVILGHDAIQHTNIVKQADVVLAIYLLWDEIGADVRRVNFHYYEPRTGHGSSLSPSIHALVAARIGDLAIAERYLKQAAEIDLNNNMGNAAGGVHAAALGGLWQAMVFGFAGLRTHADGVSLAPNLMNRWSRVAFPLQWRGRKLRVSLQPQRVQVALDGSEPLNLALAQGSKVQVLPGNEYVAERSDRGWKPWYASKERELL